MSIIERTLLAVKKTLAFIFIVLMFVCCLARAEAIDSVAISQVVQDDEMLYVLFANRDSSGAIVTGLMPSDAALKVDNKDCDTELSILSRSPYGTQYVILLDNTAQIKKNMLNKVKAEVKEWIASLNENDTVALIALTKSGIAVSELVSAEKLDLVDKLAPIKTQDCLQDSIAKGIELLSEQTKSKAVFKALIVVSCGTKNDPDLAGAVNKAQKAGVPVYAAGVQAKGYTLGGLADLAVRSGGMFFQAGDSINVCMKQMRAYISNSYVIKATLEPQMLSSAAQTLILSVRCANGAAEQSKTLKLHQLSYAQLSTPEATQKNKPVTEKTPSPSLRSANPTETELSTGAQKTGVSRRLILIIAVGVIAVAGTLIIISKKQHKRIKKDSEQERQSRKMRELNKAISAPEHDTNNEANEDKTVFLENNSDKTVFLGHAEEAALKVYLTDVETNADYSAILKDKVAIGRKKGENDIVINDSTVSGKHCLIILYDDEVFIKDLDSANGTRVFEDGRYMPVDSQTGAALKTGDRICIGETMLNVEIKKA